MAVRLTSILADPGQRASLERRFWAKVDKDGPVPEHRPELGPCWLWTAYTTREYGQCWVEGKQRYAHRLSYELHHGSIPEGLHILHHCDNPRCCNPAHLYLGDRVDNMRDMFERGRNNHVKGSAQGNAKLTASDILKIRADGRSQYAIAADYGITQPHVSKIKQRLTWAHIP